ncbi:hypothetical protein ACH5RR_004772 [Cinchona calisaya]|uniref:Uncharacterized protein n=1 Tax=Cinchona calisaya TaxID=153742 RepID=A0ABD3AYM7_9GENT
MEDDSDRIDLQVKRLSLIDFSSENDALFLHSSPSPLSATRCGLHDPQSSEKQMELEIFESSGSLSGEKEAGITPESDLDDQLPDLNESSEPDRARRKGKCNLRKSLAWDTAFFTSAGVLDPEELSCMIKGAEKTEKQKLPGIQEDIQRSMDSISTLDSDNLTMENLEAELFDDIRASIQKSSKAFNATNVNSKMISGKSQAITSMKKTDLASQNQKPALKKTVGISKSQTKQTLRMRGTAKAVKQDSVCPQEVQAAFSTESSNPTLPKPPPVINRGKPISTATAQRASLAGSQANKYGNDKTTIVASKGDQALKAPIISGARRVLPKSSSSSNSSCIGSSNSTRTKSSTSSLADRSGSVSSDNVGKSHLVAVRRKIGERTENPPPSGSTLKTPSKTAARNRTISGNSAVSAYLMTSKIYSSISPASSVSEWSSASSSSSCTINQRSNQSRTSFDASSCRSLDNDTIPSDLNKQSNGQIVEQEHGNEGITIQNESRSQVGRVSHLASVKPSGLRMPSPKIGFFDGVKSARTPTGAMRSHANLGVLPKVGPAIPSPNRSSIMKPKIGKLSHARTVSSLAKVNPQELTSPLSLGEKSLASINVSGDTSDLESLEVNDEISGESCLKVEEVGGEGLHQPNHLAVDVFGAVTNESCGVPFLQESETSLDMDAIACSKANKILANSGTCDPNTGCDGIWRPSKKVSEDARDGENALVSVLPKFLRTDEKENAVFAETIT